MRKLCAGALLGLGLTIGWCCRAMAAEGGFEDSPIVVTATRVSQASADIPASIDRIDQQELTFAQMQVNLSESLMTVPGVSAQSRQNYAQDLQISVRGFGARSSFGVRGVRLYSDGIPGTMPDGQGQFSQFDIGSADHIEVLRGPFSALYGNSSGGVIAIFTEDGQSGYEVDGTAQYGAFNTQRYALKAAGDDGAVNYVVDGTHFQTDGYRFHSDAERNNFNTKVRFNPTDSSKLTLVANAIQTPYTQDPLGLTSAQLAADPRQAGVGAIAYDTRKNLDQEQAGATFEDTWSAHDTLNASAYVGHRAATQYLAIPQAVEQRSLLYPGGVIALDRTFWGTDAHVTDQRELWSGPLQITGGASYDDLAEARRGYLNYDGSQLGVEGDLRRDEANTVYDFDQYLQAQWDPAARWRLVAGVRHNFVEIVSHGHIPTVDGADSAVRYSAVDPVGGVTFRASPHVNLYASYGKGFETPTLNDLAYRSTTGLLPGLNLGLQPARSDNYEVGVKAGSGPVRANLAAFYIKTEDELAVLANTNGRTVNQNIGETNRRGLELSTDATLGAGFSAHIAYTYIRAVVGQSYSTCVGAPCLPATVLAGSYLPAVPMNAFYGGLTWGYAPWGFTMTAETEARSHIYADDRNTAQASGYWIENLRMGFVQETRRWRFSESARIDNLTDRFYVASVIVNESNARYFEASPGRTAYIMFNAARRAE